MIISLRIFLVLSNNHVLKRQLMCPWSVACPSKDMSFPYFWSALRTLTFGPPLCKAFAQCYILIQKSVIMGQQNYLSTWLCISVLLTLTFLRNTKYMYSLMEVQSGALYFSSWVCNRRSNCASQAVNQHTQSL